MCALLDVTSGSRVGAQAGLDPDSRRWVERLSVGHPRRERTVGDLHDLLRRAAFSEMSRRRFQLQGVTGPEFDDLTLQATNDALVKILAKLDAFRGLSRFTTWAYKFVVFEISAKVAHHAWRRQPPGIAELTWDHLSDPRARRPEDSLEEQVQLRVLSGAIGELTDRQREVFLGIALNDVPVDVLAVKFHTNRNAIYKNLFDARRRLREKLSAAGHPLGGDGVEEIAASGNGGGWGRARSSSR